MRPYRLIVTNNHNNIVQTEHYYTIKDCVDRIYRMLKKMNQVEFLEKGEIVETTHIWKKTKHIKRYKITTCSPKVEYLIKFIGTGTLNVELIEYYIKIYIKKERN